MKTLTLHIHFIYNMFIIMLFASDDVYVNKVLNCFRFQLASCRPTVQRRGTEWRNGGTKNSVHDEFRFL